MFVLAFAMASVPSGTSGGAGGGMTVFHQVIPLVFMFAVFYLLLVRPQHNKAKVHKALLETMKKGDDVITAGGIHGKVSAIENDLVILEVADNVNIKITKSYVVTIKKA